MVFYGTSRSRAAQRKAVRSGRKPPKPSFNDNGSRGGGGGSSGSNSLSVTRQVDGNTVTVNAQGKVTVRNAQNQIIDSYQANKNEAGEFVTKESAAIQQEVQKSKSNQTTPPTNNQKQFLASDQVNLFSKPTTSSSSKTSNSNMLSEQKAPAKEKSFYEKLDTSFYGFLPGGVTPTEVAKSKDFKQQVLQSATRAGVPFAAYLSQRDKIIETVKINPETIEAKQKEKFIKAQELEKQGKLKGRISGFANLNPFNEQANIGKEIRKAVKEGKTYEEFRATGHGQLALTIFEKVAEKPVQYTEAVALASAQSYIFAGLAQATASTAGTALNLGRVGNYALIDLPVYIAQNEILGKGVELSSKVVGLSDTESKTLAFGTRVLVADAAGNIEGAKEFARLGVPTTYRQAFKAKVIPGISEEVLST